jgi:hypothetical protein
MNRWYAVPTLAALAFAAACSDTSNPFAVAAAGGPDAAVTVVDGDGSPCPNTGINGYTKIDNTSGNDSGAFGSFSFTKSGGLVYDINAAYTVEFCIKSGTNVGGDGTGPGSIRVTIVGEEEGIIDREDGLTQEISHVSWRLVSDPVIGANEDLTVVKTATATWDRTVKWSIEKSVLQTSYSGAPGSVFMPAWTVTADKDDRGRQNFQVTGDITIGNPNAFSVDVSVADMLNDNNAAIVDCDPVMDGAQATGTVPAKAGGVNGTLVCSYIASPSDASATKNKATVLVTSSHSPAVSGDEHEVNLDWTENLDGSDEVTISDNLAPVGTFPTTAISVGDTWTYTTSSTCSMDGLRYNSAGSYSEAVTNIAKLMAGATEIALDDATTTINCSFTQGQASLEVDQVTVRGTRGQSGATADFRVRNVSSGDAWAKLTNAKVTFTSIGAKGVRTSHTSACTISPEIANRLLAAMNTAGDRETFRFSCTLAPKVDSKANELQALVQVTAEGTDAHGRKEAKTFSSTGTQKF